MIIGKIHPGSGLGDQLFSYIVTRVIALDKGYEFGFVGKEFFKGTGFMQLDWGKDTWGAFYHIEQPAGKLVMNDDLAGTVFEFNKPYYDPEVNFIQDGTVIDGTNAQDERYWEHRMDEIREWIKIKSELLVGFYDQTCVINFRGGEYRTVPELFLTQEYWDEAIKIMKDKGYDDEHFLVTTDDVEEAKKFFPNFRITHESIGHDWSAVILADDLILANSAFGIMPSLLNSKVNQIVAPKYWAGRNVEEWRRPQNYYKKFTYL